MADVMKHYITALEKEFNDKWIVLYAGEYPAFSNDNSN